MKSKQLKPVLALVLAALTINLTFSQNLLDGVHYTEEDTSVFSTVNVDDLTEDMDLYTLDEATLHVDYYEEQTPENVVALAATMLALGLGVGFGDDETLWCFHAAYYLMLAQFPRSVLYGVLGAVYNGQSITNSNSESNFDFKRNLIDFQLKFLMFTAISTLLEVNLIYGILLAYGIGSEKFENFKTDINQFTLAAVIGFGMVLSSAITIAMHTNLFAYVDTKFKPESGNDFNQDSTRFLLNKGSIFAVSLLFHLNRRARPMPE
ncbi:MAG: hypothetical protein KJO77_10220 [Bacteroidia bacterium]|nr:hypothetical protein [Bacteroidia bacterium]NND52347.1 hypothetical protein [Flavobacteriaceae bacterium]